MFAFRAYLSSREGILGRCHRGLLALQDGEVTIITQTLEDTMFLSKLRRFIRVVWFTMLKVSIEQKQKSSCEDLRNYNRNNFCDRQLSKVKGNASIDKFLKQDKLELRIKTANKFLPPPGIEPASSR